MIARHLSTTLCTFLQPPLSTPCCVTSQISVQCLLISYCVPPTAVCENPLLATLAIIKRRRILDCSTCAQPHCLTIIADMLNTKKRLAAASQIAIRLIPLSHSTLMFPVMYNSPISAALWDRCHNIHQGISYNRPYHDVQYLGLL